MVLLMGLLEALGALIFPSVAPTPLWSGVEDLISQRQVLDRGVMTGLGDLILPTARGAQLRILLPDLGASTSLMGQEAFLRTSLGVWGDLILGVPVAPQLNREGSTSPSLKPGPVALTMASRRKVEEGPRSRAPTTVTPLPRTEAAILTPTPTPILRPTLVPIHSTTPHTPVHAHTPPIPDTTPVHALLGGIVLSGGPTRPTTATFIGTGRTT